MSYTVGLTGNVIILFLTIIDPGLNKPMYFFLGLLSFLDIWCTSATIPKMLSSYVTQSKVISYYGCVFQMLFLTWPLGVELLLLTVMAYDRYIAIGNPLRYASIINRRVCIKTTITILVIGLINSLIHTYFTFRLPYCDDNRINHFFCEIMPLLKLACADIYINEIVVYTSDFMFGICCFLLICVSYVFILKTILKIRSAEGRQKAFSTCAAHLTVVIIFYGTVIFMYVRPSASYFSDKDKVVSLDQLVSLLYAVVTPALNPIIYTLRNEEVKIALKKKINQRLHSTCVWKQYVLALFKEFG
ncbi:unnamed protein product [Staurois parvus]|uniref:Olfactory receptor n=1 Tax=Staurois parvus TaxID=386267 RepID=A0ABN9DNM5_9NEOB|nr:unnamed protein product [Staurois parvus]